MGWGLGFSDPDWFKGKVGRGGAVEAEPQVQQMILPRPKMTKVLYYFSFMNASFEYLDLCL